jgi:FtsP/CotA-like multicopper oxidase with cupredoxin domain
MAKPKYPLILKVAVIGFLNSWHCASADTYQLQIDEKSVNLIGLSQQAIVANDSLPAPTLHWREGEQVTLQVTNNLKEQSSIHWHGILLPYQMESTPVQMGRAALDR